MVAPLTVGQGITLGAGVTLHPLTVTANGQNVSSGPANPGFFFATLNRSLPGWDYFALNGSNDSWYVSGDLGSGITSARVVGVSNDGNSVFPIINRGAFQAGATYSFSGH